MPSLAVAQAFEARLGTWSNIGACPFVDLNTVSDVPKPPYVEIEYPVAIEDRASSGKPAVFRERGGARFVVTVAAFMPNWKVTAGGWIEELRDLFRAQFFDNVETLEAGPPALDDRNRAGTKYKISFVVLYVSDSIK